MRHAVRAYLLLSHKITCRQNEEGDIVALLIKSKFRSTSVHALSRMPTSGMFKFARTLADIPATLLKEDQTTLQHDPRPVLQDEKKSLKRRSTTDLVDSDCDPHQKKFNLGLEHAIKIPRCIIPYVQVVPPVVERGVKRLTLQRKRRSTCNLIDLDYGLLSKAKKISNTSLSCHNLNSSYSDKSNTISPTLTRRLSTLSIDDGIVV